MAENKLCSKCGLYPRIKTTSRSHPTTCSVCRLSYQRMWVKTEKGKECIRKQNIRHRLRHPKRYQVISRTGLRFQAWNSEKERDWVYKSRTKPENVRSWADSLAKWIEEIEH